MRVGILGGGQLGRMMALAGYPLGIRCTVLDPAAECCAGQVCRHIQGEFDDYRALYELARASDVVTFEFENVAVESARWLAERVPVFPSPRALEVGQERLAETSEEMPQGTRPTPDQSLSWIPTPSAPSGRRGGSSAGAADSTSGSSNGRLSR